MSFPRYESYKDSGVEWLGNVPEHWNVARLGYECDTVVPMRDKPEDLTGEIPWIRIEDFNGKYISSSKSGQGVSEATVSAMNLKVFPAGSVLCSCSCSMGATAIVTRPLVTNQTFIGIVPKSGYLSDFLFYLFLAATDHLNSIGTGAIQSYLSRDDFRRLRIPHPKYSEQLSITSFLDRETAKIDALIAEQQRLIELLKEKRQAVISHAVTKGLNPDDVTMKDSGIEWLGEVPTHWEIKPLKRAVTLQRGHDLPSDNRIEGEVPIVSSGGITGYHNEAITSAPTIVTGRYGTIGEFIYVEKNCWPLNTSLYAVEMYDNLPKFLWYMLQSYKEHFILNSLKAAVPGVDRNDIHPIKITIPYTDEQAEIVAFLDKETTKLDTLTAEAQHGIELLKERRAALISAAVTGKIDVRNLVFGISEKEEMYVE
jgi:type I restriction enzyme S subunit